MVFYCFGTVIGYLISINQYFISFLGSIGAISSEDVTNWVDISNPAYYHTYIIIGIVAILAFPIACFKDISAFRYLTIFGVTIVAYIAIVTAAQSYWFIENNIGPSGEGENIVYAKFTLQSLTGWAICTYAYTCHANVFPVRAELQRAQDSRMKKIANRVVTTLTIIYSTMAVTGYLSVPNSTPQIFINRDAGTIFNNDILITIARAGMSLNLFFAVPLNMNPLRLQLLILFKKDPKALSDSSRIIFTFFVLMACAGCAMLLPDIVVALSILGGFCSTSLCSTFPTLLYLKFTKMRKDHWKRIGVWAVGIVTTVMGFSSAIVTILNLIGLVEFDKTS